MQLTDKAKNNYDKFTTNLDLTINETDPEFAEIFNNFLFDEVYEESNLPDRSKYLIILASLITNQSLNQYNEVLESAINIGITPIEIKEVLYQTVPYTGIAKAYDFFDITNQKFEELGIDLPLNGQATTTRNNRYEKGSQIQQKFFGEETIKQMNENAPDDQKHFNKYLEGYCFGDFYTRCGLSESDRELITFSILASLGGCENQLRGHTAGNLSVGNDKSVLINAVTMLMPFIGFPRTLNTLAIINEICD